MALETNNQQELAQLFPCVVFNKILMLSMFICCVVGSEPAVAPVGALVLLGFHGLGVRILGSGIKP